MIEKSIVDVICDIKEEEFSKPENQRALYHKNCGETLCEACKIKYEIDIDEKYFKALAPYGFGLQVGKTCGAFAGCVASIGLIFCEDKPSTNDRMKEVTALWVQEFIKEFGSINCEDLRPKYATPKEGCLPFQKMVGEFFEEFMKSVLKKDA